MTGGGNPPQFPAANPGNLPNSSPNPLPNTAGTNDNGLNPAGQLTSNSRGVFGLEGLTLQPVAGDGTLGFMILSKGKSVRLNGGTRILLMTK